VTFRSFKTFLFLSVSRFLSQIFTLSGAVVLKQSNDNGQFLGEREGYLKFCTSLFKSGSRSNVEWFQFG